MKFYHNIFYFVQVLVILSANFIEGGLSLHDSAPKITNIYDCLSTISSDLSFRSFQQGKQSLYCRTNALPSNIISGILDDCRGLKSCSFGSMAGISNGPSTNIRQNVYQTWIRNVGSTQSLQAYVGNVDARTTLVRFTELIRSTIEEGPRGILPSNLIELSYLSYEPGAFYRRHVDVSFIDADTRDSERCISLLLYLGDINDDREWDTTTDGGSLRIYGKQHSQWVKKSNNNYISDADVAANIEPQSGTLVLFDSLTVPHEVLTTHRSRQCVVGWFGRSKVVNRET
jgi:SM-20-related protein